MEDRIEKDEPWITSAEAAKHMGLSGVKMLYKHIQCGNVPKGLVHRFAGRLRFKRSELDQLINSAHTGEENT